MPVVHMMVGIQGSGKTTYAKRMNKETGIEIVSTDTIRKEMIDFKESNVFPMVYKRCKELILENKDIIFDATSITPSVRKRFIDSLKELGVDRSMYKIYVYYFIPDVELSKERIQRRNEMGIERYMPLEVIEKYNNEIIPPTKEEGFDKILFISSDDFSIKRTII